MGKLISLIIRDGRQRRRIYCNGEAESCAEELGRAVAGVLGRKTVQVTRNRQTGKGNIVSTGLPEREWQNRERVGVGKVWEGEGCGIKERGKGNR